MVDLMDPDAPAQVIATAVEEFGGLDILVNNAGDPPPGASLPRFSFLAPADADWREMFEWASAMVVAGPRGGVVPRSIPPITRAATFSPRTVTRPGASRVIYDFGEVRAGRHVLTDDPNHERAVAGVSAVIAYLGESLRRGQISARERDR
jgi:NAD(P)-dependent dehydrogenase (short-subunit alcohol dehydrogenase family)